MVKEYYSVDCGLSRFEMLNPWIRWTKTQKMLLLMCLGTAFLFYLKVTSAAVQVRFISMYLIFYRVERVTVCFKSILEDSQHDFDEIQVMFFKL